MSKKQTKKEEAHKYYKWSKNGKSIKEIAEMFDVPEDYIRKLLFFYF